MKRTYLLAMTTALMFAAGTTIAGPNCKKKNAPQDGSEEGIYEVSAEGEKKGCKNKNREGSEEGIYEVAERDGEARGERPERGERGERGERRDRKRPSPLKALDLSEDQQEEVKAIMEGAREEAKSIMEEVKAKKEAGEEIDRESVREQMMAVRKAAMQDVYDNVLTEEQQAKMDEIRAKMEERRAEREANGGERPERGDRKGKGGDKPERGGDGGGLDL